MIRIIKKISVFALILLLFACASSMMIGKKDYRLFNKKIYFKDGAKVDLKKYLGSNIEIIRNDSDIFLISMSKSIIKISLSDKKLNWVKEINTIPENNFAFDKDNIYFNGVNNNFYILNYESGDIKYIYINSNVKTIKEVRKPIIHKNLVLVFFNDKRIIIFDKINNKVLLDKNYDTVTNDNGVLVIDGKNFNWNLL